MRWRWLQALKEIAARRGIGLVYKTSFDKANRTSGAGARGVGLEAALPIFAEIRETLGLPVITDVHESAQCAPVAQGRRRAADPRLPLPPDRPSDRRGAHRPGGQRQEGPVPRALGHEERRRQARRRRRGRHPGDRARRRASATTRSSPTCARCRSWRARPARR